MNQFERVMIFIDGSNIFKSIQNFSHETGRNFKIDYIKLRDYLCNGRDMIRSYYYGSEETESNSAHQGFYINSKLPGLRSFLNHLESILIQTEKRRSGRKA